MLYSTGYGICPICNKGRGVVNHKKCSRILQKQRNNEEWGKTINKQHEDEAKKTAIKASTQRVRRINYFEGYIK